MAFGWPTIINFIAYYQLFSEDPFPKRIFSVDRVALSVVPADVKEFYHGELKAERTRLI